MSVRRLLLFFLACALMVPVSGAGQAAKSAADKRLFEMAHKACSAQYPYASRPHINYAGGWFRCVEPRWKKHDRRRKKD